MDTYEYTVRNYTPNSCVTITLANVTPVSRGAELLRPEEGFYAQIEKLRQVNVDKSKT